MMTMNLEIPRRKRVLLSMPWICFCIAILCLYVKLSTVFENKKDIVRVSATATPASKNNFIAISTRTPFNICNNLTFPGNMASDRWQNIGTNEIAFVYSAFREINNITVIGISLETGLFVCQLWYKTPDRSSMVAVSVEAIVETIDLKTEMSYRYRSTMFKCTVPREKRDGTLVGVSVSEAPCHQPTNVLPVIRIEYANVSNKYVRNSFLDVSKKYTVCVSPLHNNYSRAHELIEWIELNRILGADKFIFYKLSCTPIISQILQSYVKGGIVSVLDWELPKKITDEQKYIKYFGQLSALNDCLFRNKGHSEFVVNMDLDEFIIPRQKDVMTWDQMLRQWPKHDVYLFLHVYFTPKRIDSRTRYVYDWYKSARELHLATLLRLTRDSRIWTVSRRTKYFARTQTTSILGIHKVLRTSGKKLVVRQSSALLHHYRVAYKDVTQGPFDDTVLKKYKDSLIKNVSEKWKTLMAYQTSKFRTSPFSEHLQATDKMWKNDQTLS